MQLLKKRVSFLLTLVMIVSALPVAAHAEEPVVSSLEELESAIDTADDGSAIVIGKTILLDGGDVIGSAEKRITLQRAETFTDNAMFTVLTNDGAAARFQNVVIDGNSIEAQNSAIFICGDVFLSSVTVENCLSANNGGAIYIESGTVEITNCEFANNTSANAGGHLFVGFTASAKISNSTFIGGVAVGDGGAILNVGNLEIENTSITGNSANNGGGISNSSETLCLIKGGTISGNVASVAAGGIQALSPVSIDATKVYGNTASAYGADICCAGELSIISAINDYVGLYENGNLYPLGWYTDNRYDDEDEALLAIPFSNVSGTFRIKFVFGEAPGPEPEPEPEPVFEPESEYHSPSHSHRNYEEPETEIIKQNNFLCGSAMVDNEAVSCFCDTITRFIPSEKTIDRGEIAGIIAGLLTNESRASIKPDSAFFDDISASPYRSSIDLLAAAGILVGCNDNKYYPDGKFTWGALITVFSRFTEPQDIELSFIDAAGHWSEAAVKTVVAAGWIEDKPIDFAKAVTYGDLVAFLLCIVEQG